MASLYKRPKSHFWWVKFRVYWASRITAIWEVKFLSLLMDEAVRRGFAVTNPCIRLGLNLG